MIKTSTEICSIYSIEGVGMEKAIEMVAKAGFDAWDLSMFNMGWYNWKTDEITINKDCPLNQPNAKAFVKNLRKIGEDNGIVCNQSHAPFPSWSKQIRDLYKRAIEFTAIAGGKICVIHPDNDATAEKNAEMYAELLPFAKEHNVKIAAENMWNWKDGQASNAACSNEVDFLKHFEALKDDYFVACVDIGHAEMQGLNTSAEKMITALNEKVQCLHIHDNDLHRDKHQIPFSMDIDFEKVINALKKINYTGDLTLECDCYLSSRGYKENPKNVFNGVCELYKAVNKLREMFNK